MVTTRLPSAGFSITIRIAVTADASSIGRLTTCVGEAGAIVTALDVVDSDPVSVIADLTCDTADANHAEQVVAALRALPGVEVRKVSDRTFLLHLGGKIEVTPKVALRNRASISKHRGAAMSSRLIAPYPGAMARTIDTISSVSWVSRTTGQASTPPKRLNSAALPSITGSAAAGPRLPSPSTAEPSVTTATVLRLMVSRRASAGLSASARQTRATPGV